MKNKQESGMLGNRGRLVGRKFFAIVAYLVGLVVVTLSTDDLPKIEMYAKWGAIAISAFQVSQGAVDFSDNKKGQKNG